MSGLGNARRREVPANASAWLEPVGTGHLPLQVRPAVDVDLVGWAREHRAIVDGWLHRHGAVLFRGFHVGVGKGGAGFAEAAEALAGAALPYRERSSPRTEITPGVYSSTDHPADQPIRLHNENSYQHSFPARLVFGCLTPASAGGATPLADCRKVLDRIEPEIVAAFRERGVRYVRNYPPASAGGIGMPWQEAFQTTDRSRVEAYCGIARITAQWRPDGGLRTWQTRPAVATHPVTGEAVWFNHAAFFHVSSLEPEVRDAMLAQYDEADLPANTYYGDGFPIDGGTLTRIRQAYQAETAAAPWQRGDVLLVDNLLAAHGREPYRGERRVVVSMAGALDHDGLPSAPAVTP